MSDILLVGGAGFVGSNLINYLVQHSTHTVSSIDNLEQTKRLYNLQPALQSKNRHQFYLARAEDAHIRAKIFEIESPDVVLYNLSSYHIRNINSENQWQYISILQSWVADCLKWGVKKLVILLDHTALYDDLDIWAKEFLNICEQYATEANNLTIQTIVPSYVYGPRQGLNHELPCLIQCVLQGAGRLNPSKKFMDLIYIKDYFWVLKEFIEENNNSGLYQIIGHECSSMKHIVSYLEAISNGTDEKLYLGAAVYKQNFMSEPNNVSWKPRYNLQSALEHTMCWYNVNNWAWEN